MLILIMGDGCPAHLLILIIAIRWCVFALLSKVVDLMRFAFVHESEFCAQ